MSTANKKPLGSTIRRTSTTPVDTSAPSPVRRPSRSPTPSTTTANGVARTRSLRGPNAGAPVSARAAAKRSGVGASGLSTTAASSDIEDDEVRAARESIIDDLKVRLEKAETEAEEKSRQLKVLEERLSEALERGATFEEQLHEHRKQAESLNHEKRESMRREREMETIYEAERVAMGREKAEMMAREEEMQGIIQRLKDSLSSRELRSNFDDELRIGRSSNTSSPSLENGHFAPPSSLQRSDSKNNSKLVLQKDRMIESLRLELAEAQIKLVESDHTEGGRVQELERLVMETRVTNARLMEENESFQLLLSEKTLNGDFSKNDLLYNQTREENQAGPTSSLADELESAAEGGNEKYRRLETEMRSLRDTNKALTVYINSIIERLLNHKEFEAILDKTPGLMAGPNAASARHASAEKALPLPPPPPPPPEASGQSILQRAKSVAIGAGRARPRPQSYMPPPVNAPSTVENQVTAPSISLGRSHSLRSSGHRRANSEWAPGAPLANQMYRGPPSTAGSVSPPVRTSSFFALAPAPGNPNAAARIPSNSNAPTAKRPGSSSNSTVSDTSGEVSSSSPPHSHHSHGAGGPAQIAGNKLRPLRLVQENTDSARKTSDGQTEEEKKMAKRGSWMGWFNRGKEEDPNQAGPNTINEESMGE